MIDHKIFLGILTLCIGCVSYTFYFQAIFRGKIKPDPFSWSIWGLLAAVTFFAQATGGGGAGSWATAFTALACLLIAATTFRKNDRKKQPTLIDAFSFGAALFGLCLWYFTNDPLFAVVTAVGIGAAGFLPTFVKSFSRPKDEAPITFALNAVKFGLAFFALESFNLVTWLYPTAMVVMNTSLAGILLYGRSRQQKF